MELEVLEEEEEQVGIEVAEIEGAEKMTGVEINSLDRTTNILM
jgi:hypothetical protein